MCFLKGPKQEAPPAPPSQSAMQAAELRQQRRSALADQTSGYGSTLLTGGAGVPGEPNLARKTLLGA